MAKPKPLRDPIAREFVDCVLKDWNGELGFAPKVLMALGESEFDILDLLRVIECGVTTSLEKEAPNETVIQRFGAVDNGATLSVTLIFDQNMPELTIAGFSKL